MADKAVRSPDYTDWLGEVKSRIRSARLSAARSLNRELILLYWDIGRGILHKQEELGWGKSVVDQLATDLKKELPGVAGFSARNLWDMRRLVESYTSSDFLAQVAQQLGDFELGSDLRQTVADLEGGTTKRPERLTGLQEPEVADFLRQLVADVPWGHNLLILNKLSDAASRLYYLGATVRFGWTRKVLLNQIKAGAYERSLSSGKSHNFPLALPEHLAEQAEEMLKSSYSLEFLGISREVRERELEDRLVEKLKEFILELGYGFCFIGRQYRLTLGNKEYFIDLLFYHRFLKSLVAFELKIGSFEPEFAGKMDFYLNLLNDRERARDDNPSIGIILCAEKDDVEVEFALKSKTNPIGVAEYQLSSTLPKDLEGKLPSAQELSEAIGLPVKSTAKRD